MVLNDEEMLEVEGGSGLAAGIGLAVLGGLFVFAMGIIDGILHPKKC